MPRFPHPSSALSLLALALVLAAAPARAGETAEDARPTAGFRHEHAALRTHLAELDAEVRGLAAASPEARRATMSAIAAALRDHVVAHAEWEEAHLYPAVDRRAIPAAAAAGREPFTASMRHEHRIVGRWTDELAALARDASPDPAVFARGADRLLGLITAHFEEEEEVLLPILDRTTTRHELEAELGAGGHS